MNNYPTRKKLWFFAAALMITAAAPGFTQEVTIPHTFSAGEVISAFQMNTNFQTLADKANALDSVINSLSVSNSFWTYDSGILTYSSGNVGIGTTAPGFPLTVANEAGITAGAHILATFFRGDGAGQNGGVSLGYYADGTNQTGGYIRSEDDLPLMLGTVGTPQAVTITDTGNVGIGTTSPLSTLHVDGTFQITGDQELRFGDEYQIIKYVDGAGMTMQSPGDVLVILDNNGNQNNSAFYVARDNRDPDLATKIFTVQEDGNVGIGTTSPGAYKLYVAGDAYTTGTWGTSDIRWKKDIKPIGSVLEKIGELSAVSFQWKAEEHAALSFDSGQHIGVIAQEVEQVFPELVKTNSDGYKAVAYDKLTAVLIEAVKEQQTQIEALQEEIEALKQ